MSQSKEGSKNYKKKSNHYVDKADLHRRMTDFKQDPENVRLVEEGERPKIPESIAQDIMKICHNKSYHWKFGDKYPFREDMVLNAIEDCIRYIWNYDEIKYDNPFGYFDRIAYFSFISTIKKEKARFLDKVSYVQNIGVMPEFFDNSLLGDSTIDDTNQFREIGENIQKYFEYELPQKKKKKKEKPNALEEIEVADEDQD